MSCRSRTKMYHCGYPLVEERYTHKETHKCNAGGVLKMHHSKSTTLKAIDGRYLLWESSNFKKSQPKEHAIKAIRTFKKRTKTSSSTHWFLFFLPYNRCLYILVCMGKRHRKHISYSLRVKPRRGGTTFAAASGGRMSSGNCGK